MRSPRYVRESNTSVIDPFIADKLPAQPVSDRTHENRRYILQKLKTVDLASYDVATITTRDMALYLKSLPSDSMRQQYRAQLHSVMKWAINEGYIERTPVADTGAPRVVRICVRLTDEGYEAIYAVAAPWLRNLMGLIRLTLQRPEDLLGLCWEACTGQQIRIEQGKTGTRLAIHVRPRIATLLARCRDDIASPYVIHRIPERIKSRQQRSQRRDHHTQILRTQASRAFTAVLKRCEFFSGIQNPPTLYGCKFLGVAQLRQQGWSKEFGTAVDWASLGADDRALCAGTWCPV